MFSRPALVLLLLVTVVVPRTAGADKMDTLTRALMQDPSYKVRVQAALSLGRLHDARAVPALIQALKDDDPTVRGVAATSLGQIGDRASADALLEATRDPADFVRTQAKKALALVAREPSPAPRAGARFFIAVGFQEAGRSPQFTQLVRDALTRELAKLSTVTLGQAVSTRRLPGFLVDGSIQRLSSTMTGGGLQVECDLKVFVATYPGRAIRMTATEGASVQTGSGPGQTESAKRDCLEASVEAVAADVAKFLRTVE